MKLMFYQLNYPVWLALRSTQFELECRAFDWRTLEVLRQQLTLGAWSARWQRRQKAVILRSPQNDKNARRAFVVHEWALTRTIQSPEIVRLFRILLTFSKSFVLSGRLSFRTDFVSRF